MESMDTGADPPEGPSQEIRDGYIEFLTLCGAIDPKNFRSVGGYLVAIVGFEGKTYLAFYDSVTDKPFVLSQQEVLAIAEVVASLEQGPGGDGVPGPRQPPGIT